MPQVLRSARDGQIAVKEFYTAGDLAFLMGVAHATASRLIDQRRDLRHLVAHQETATANNPWRPGCIRAAEPRLPVHARQAQRL